jgi:hypothetical protein
MQYKIEKSRNGLDIITIDGKLIHSKFQPEQEASNFKIDGKNVIAVFGIGIGYHITNIVSNNPESIIIVYDPFEDIRELYLKKYAGKNIPMKAFFLSKIDEGEIFDIFEKTGFLFEGKICFYSNPGYKNLFPVEEVRFQEAIKKNIEIFSQNIMTESAFLHMWTKNFIYNSRSFGKYPLINFVKNKLDDNLAVIACAGPGLDGEIPSIKKNRDMITLFAVDTAIKPLFKNNITPDFVVSLDGQYHSFDDFIKDESEETCYIFDVVSCPQATRLVKNKFFTVTDNIFKNSMVELFFKHNNIKAEKIQTGGTVADYTLDICEKLGFKNIYFAGLDLSFPDLTTHCKNSPFYEKTGFNSHYLNTRETIIIKAIASRKIKYAESKIREEKVLTDFVLENYAFYINKYQEIFSGLKIYNSMQKGVRIFNLINTGLDVLISSISTKRIKYDELLGLSDKYYFDDDSLNGFYDKMINMFFQITVILKDMLCKEESKNSGKIVDYIFGTLPLLKRIVRFTQFSLNKKGVKEGDIFYLETGFAVLQTSYFFIRTFQKILKLKN